jgi:hypothetical protein
MKNKERFEIFCEFTSNTIRKEKSFPYNEYTEYSIKIYTYDKSWTIHKRYREFAILHNKLLQLIDDLPFFPKKKLFSTNEKIINERILLLENYLNEVLKKLNSQLFSKLYEFLHNFINLNNLKSINNSQLTNHEKNKVSILRTESTLFENYSTGSEKSDIETTVRFKTSRSENCIINKDILKNFCPIVDSVKETLAEFLTGLSSEEGNLSIFCKSFFSYISTHWTNFKFEDINLLYFGNQREKKGLMYYIGQVKENPFGSVSCLELLQSLLNYEVNPDCDYYIHVFRYGHLEDIIQMNFIDYYEENKHDSLIICLKLLKIWLSNNERIKFTPSDVLEHDVLIRIYNETNR